MRRAHVSAYGTKSKREREKGRKNEKEKRVSIFTYHR